MLEENFMSVIQAHTESCYQKMRIVKKFESGNISRKELQKYLCRHYAEIRTFIDLKLPERFRICPRGAYSAKQYFWTLLKEEQGNFELGQDHAELFKPACYALGITEEELEKEYKQYVSSFNYLRETEPSLFALVQELATSYAWESFITKAGSNIMLMLKNKFAFDKKAMSYFDVHLEADSEHSDYSAKILSEYVTDESLLKTAVEAITQTLIDKNYLDN